MIWKSMLLSALVFVAACGGTGSFYVQNEDAFVGTEYTDDTLVVQQEASADACINDICGNISEQFRLTYNADAGVTIQGQFEAPGVKLTIDHAGDSTTVCLVSAFGFGPYCWTPDAPTEDSHADDSS